jgi:uncharacterized protein (TIGR02246 family)
VRVIGFPRGINENQKVKTATRLSGKGFHRALECAGMSIRVRKQRAAVIVAIVLLSCAGSAQQRSAEVLSVEAQRVKALTANDFAALDRLLADDLSYTHSSGETQSKQEFLEMVRSGKLRYVTFREEGVRARVYGDTAVINGTAFVTVQPGTEPKRDLHIVFVDVYVRRGRNWQMVAWQSTRIPAQQP